MHTQEQADARESSLKQLLEEARAEVAHLRSTQLHGPAHNTDKRALIEAFRGVGHVGEGCAGPEGGDRPLSVSSAHPPDQAVWRANGRAGPLLMEPPEMPDVPVRFQLSVRDDVLDVSRDPLRNASGEVGKGVPGQSQGLGEFKLLTPPDTRVPGQSQGLGEFKLLSPPDTPLQSLPRRSPPGHRNDDRTGGGGEVTLEEPGNAVGTGGSGAGGLKEQGHVNPAALKMQIAAKRASLVSKFQNLQSASKRVPGASALNAGGDVDGHAGGQAGRSVRGPADASKQSTASTLLDVDHGLTVGATPIEGGGGRGAAQAGSGAGVKLIGLFDGVL